MLMKFIVVAAVISLMTLHASLACAEVGDTSIIDAVAVKPGTARAILLLHQARPWTEESTTLLQRKLDFYAEAISSGRLAEQKPEVRGKSIRIIVVYSEVPTPAAEQLLNHFKSTMAQQEVSLVWGNRKQVITLADAP